MGSRQEDRFQKGHKAAPEQAEARIGLALRAEEDRETETAVNGEATDIDPAE